MNKNTRNLLRITMVVFITSAAVPEVLAKPTLLLQSLYAARMLCLLAWLWWLTGENKK